MKRWAYHLWWKIGTVLLLGFAIFSGLYLPLGPGIASVEPLMVEQAGKDFAVTVQTYQAPITPDDEVIMMLFQTSGAKWCATRVDVSPGQLIGFFSGLPISAEGKSETYSLYIESPATGSFFLRQAVRLQGSEATVGEAVTCSRSPQALNAPYLHFPNREILYETIRNLFFHVPMWFAMTLLLLFSVSHSIAYLSTSKIVYDQVARISAGIALFYGTLGILTGMQWANFTWGAPWVNDPKLNGAAVGMLIYLAYFVLRSSLPQTLARARISSVYSIFSFILFVVFVFVLPRLTDSLHPGSGGNPGFKSYDLDNTMRPVFYAAVLGFTGLGLWFTALIHRIEIADQKKDSLI